MKTTCVLLLLVGVAPIAAQQRTDATFRFSNPQPAFPREQGPRLCMDVAHLTFQSPERNPGAYQPFTDLLDGDGYRVKDTAQQFSSSMLAECDILVIANALARETLRDVAFRPVGCFTRDELTAVYQWIRNGGGLLLIADHQPTLGGAIDLGAMLGVVMVDGYAFLNPSRPRKLPEVFSRAGGHLPDHPILRGRDTTESIETVGSFSGSALLGLQEWSPLLLISPQSVAEVDPGYTVFKVPYELWPRFSIAGWSTLRPDV
jgi:hypothetical protein